MPRPLVPTQDLAAQFRSIEPHVRAAIDRVLASQQFILGPEIAALEKEVASSAGLPHAVAVSSGTDALLATLTALGVGPGDDVVTTPFTFIATITAIARVGARARFVDIDPETFLLDAAALEAALTPRTRAILPVHLFGQMCDMTAIARVATKHGIPVVEDAAQAIGARRGGKPVGHGSHAATLSFFPSKNLGAMGDAGMVLTSHEDLAARLRLLRNHGQEPKHVCQTVGGNFRMDEMQAAILRAKLPFLPEWTRARQERARAYRDAFKAIDPELVRLPDTAPDAEHVRNQLVVRSPHRDALRAFLGDRGIETAIYYPVPMHLQPAFASWGYAGGDFPEAERAASEVLALPLYPELPLASIETVADAVSDFCTRRSK